MLSVLAFVEALARQQLLFSALASSAFLVYLAPEHESNRPSTLAVSQLGGATIGWGCHVILGEGYLSAGLAMVLTIFGMVLTKRVHAPAVSTSLSFGLRAGHEQSLVLFGLAVFITTLLIVSQRVVMRLLLRWKPSGTT